MVVYAESYFLVFRFRYAAGIVHESRYLIQSGLNYFLVW